MKVIYKITSPSNKVYIGQAHNFEKRFKRYKLLACKAQKKLFNSLKKYGVESHLFKIVAELPNDISQQVLDEYEKLFILQYKFCGVQLLNLTDGGQGVVGYVYTKKDRTKISKGKIGKKKSEETKLKMSLYHQNRPKQHSINCAKSKSRPVIQYSLEGVFIKEWVSLLDATSNNKGDIRSCINGRQYVAGGFIWEYKHNKSVNILDKIKHNKSLSDKRELERRKNISNFYQVK